MNPNNQQNYFNNYSNGYKLSPSNQQNNSQQNNPLQFNTNNTNTLNIPKSNFYNTTSISPT